MEDNKKCTTIWLRPSVIRRMDAWMEEANCRSRSEFIEKAVRFYMGYLGTEDTSEYLSDALVATLRGIIADSTNRTNGILFKCAVEQGIMAHTIAAHFRDTLEDRRALRGYVVDEVKRTNGQIRFEDAQDVREGLEDAFDFRQGCRIDGDAVVDDGILEDVDVLGQVEHGGAGQGRIEIVAHGVFKGFFVFVSRFQELLGFRRFSTGRHSQEFQDVVDGCTQTFEAARHFFQPFVAEV